MFDVVISFAVADNNTVFVPLNLRLLSPSGLLPQLRQLFLRRML